jgi:hypothetical protein
MYFILIQKCGIVNITRKTNALNEKKAGFIKGGNEYEDIEKNW